MTDDLQVFIPPCWDGCVCVCVCVCVSALTPIFCIHVIERCARPGAYVTSVYTCVIPKVMTLFSGLHSFPRSTSSSRACWVKPCGGEPLCQCLLTCKWTLSSGLAEVVAHGATPYMRDPMSVAIFGSIFLHIISGTSDTRGCLPRGCKA